MICLIKVGLFNGLRLAAKGDVVVQTLTLAIALVNVIDAAEHCSVGEYLVRPGRRPQRSWRRFRLRKTLHIFVMKIIIVDARAIHSIPLESELRAVALDSDLVNEKIAVVQMPWTS